MDFELNSCFWCNTRSDFRWCVVQWTPIRVQKSIALFRVKENREAKAIANLSINTKLFEAYYAIVTAAKHYL